jgi:hypothetical protein
MENNNGKESKQKKAYVKPTVVKHTAASLVVGSGSCTQYSSKSISYGCVQGYVTNTVTYYH